MWFPPLFFNLKPTPQRWPMPCSQGGGAACKYSGLRAPWSKAEAGKVQRASGAGAWDAEYNYVRE